MGSAVGVDKSSSLEQGFSFRDDDIDDAQMVKGFSFSNKRQESGISIVDEANLKTLKMIRPTFLDVPFINSSPFGQYRFEKVLAKGRFSTVHVGKHIKEDKIVAIKEIMLSNLNKTEVVNLKYDMNVLSQIEHPNILNLFAVHSPPIRSTHHTSKLFQIQEFLSGEKVISAIGKLDDFHESDVLRIMTQLISAVQYLHVRGVVHNCINTDNLVFDVDFISGFANLKLINFSYCECESIPRRSKRSNPVTVFIAPELLNTGHKSVVSTKSDMYSVGVVMHVLLSGRKPSSFLTLEQTFEYREFGMVSPWAKNLLIKLLEQDPTKRYSVDEAYRHPWMHNAWSGSKSQRPTYTGSSSTMYNGSSSTMATFAVGLDSQSSDASGSPHSKSVKPAAQNASRQSIREEGDDEEYNDDDNNNINNNNNNNNELSIDVSGGISSGVICGPHGVGDLSNNLYLLREFTLL